MLIERSHRLLEKPGTEMLKGRIIPGALEPAYDKLRVEGQKKMFNIESATKEQTCVIKLFTPTNLLPTTEILQRTPSAVVVELATVVKHDCPLVDKVARTLVHCGTVTSPLFQKLFLVLVIPNLTVIVLVLVPPMGHEAGQMVICAKPHGCGERESWWAEVFFYCS